jgi:hypothetical protein
MQHVLTRCDRAPPPIASLLVQRAGTSGGLNDYLILNLSNGLLQPATGNNVRRLFPHTEEGWSCICVMLALTLRTKSAALYLGARYW